jgi:chromosome segregation ATPase
MQEGDVADTQAQIDELKNELRFWTVKYEETRKEYESILGDPSQEQRINDLDHSLCQLRDVIEDLEKRYYALKNDNIKS